MELLTVLLLICQHAETTARLPESTSAAILLPTAALLLGSGVLAFAILRRR